jgi:hypothetical protein
MRELDAVILGLAGLARRCNHLARALERVIGVRPRVSRWTAAELRQIRKRYPHERSDTIARDLGRPVSQVYQAATRLGLHKSKAYLKSGLPDLNKKGNAGCFRKGFLPWNKGMKGWSAKGTERSRFKMGHRPQTWRPIGTVSVDADGYSWTKIKEAPRRDWAWKMTHVLLWEKHRGKVPRGRIVVFKDKNRAHIALENLETVTRQENMARNTIHNYPKPIKDLMHMRGVLNRAINKRRKNEDD